MLHIVTTPPVAEPVTVDQCRLQIGIGNPGDASRDEIIRLRIRAARLWCESYASSYFMRQTVTAYADGLETPDCDCCAAFNLKKPLVSVNSFKYIDSSGNDVTLDPSQYIVDTVQNRVVPAYGVNWPSVRRQPNSIRIEYLAGKASAAEVDQRIKEAIMFIVMQWERFQNVSIETAVYPPDFPNVCKNLLSEFVDYRGIV
jgi:uncharacterized phiE125 gp8 family phage protein